MLSWCILLLALCLWPSVDATHEETLVLRQLPHVKKVLAHFDFLTESNGSSDALLPLPLQQILTKYEAHAFQLTFSMGKYSTARYGTPRILQNVWNRPAPDAHAPFGTRLQAFFNHNDDILAKWNGITSELGGIFSASLNQMDESVVIKSNAPPAHLGAFIAPTSLCEDCAFLHGVLAREELCTENLTPWLKMLPCRAYAGLGRLLDPIQLLSGEYFSLSVHLTRGANGWRLEQQLTTVQNVLDTKWSLLSLFFSSNNKEDPLDACPLAQKSTIVTEGHGDDDRVVMDLHERRIPLSEPWSYVPKAIDQPAKQDVVSVHRFVTGYGQVHGGLAVQIANHHATCGIRVHYEDVIPWYLRLYFSTFRAKMYALNGPEEQENSASFIQETNFQPAELRGRPNEFSVELEIPPQHSVVFSTDFDKVFLRLSEHPPDANRGFDIPSGIATVHNQCQDEALVVYTEPLLVPLPTPDFSMPYNVITMTSTVVAFFVGSMLNTLLRKAPRLKQMMSKKTA